MAQHISIKYAEVPRHPPGSAASIDYLEEHGFAVIANALSTEQAKHALDLLWDYLEELGTGIDRHDVETWDNDRWPTAVHGGILPSYGIGHCASQWYIRDQPAVRQSFASVWQTDDLLTSFDGVALWRPWQVKQHWQTNDGPSWLHIDQHPVGRPGKHCVQGLVNLLPTSVASGGNVMVPGSHHRFADIPTEYAERLKNVPPMIDHFRFPNDDPMLGDTQPIQAHMEPGDLMLWDSRTIHCSSPGTDAPDKLQQHNPQQLVRAASLICMMPRAKSNAEVIEQRKMAVQNRISTTNWSDRFINADEFAPIVAADGEKYQLPPVPTLNRNQLNLVGWTDSEMAG